MDRVKDPADPERCKGAAPDGQCRNRAEPGSDYCHVHGGKSNVEEQDLGLYHLTKAQYRRRLAELKGHEEVKSLRDEIALTRILVEERFNSIKNDADLLAAYSTVNGLMLTLERLIKTSHQIETNLGALLAKPTVILLGQALVNIIVEELRDVADYEVRVDRIVERLYSTIEQTTNVES